MRGRVIVPFVTALAIFLGPSYPSAAQEELDEFAETDELDESEPAQAQRFIKESSVSMGGMLVEQTGRSSKFNEYKDDSSRVFIERLLFGVDDTQSGAFFDFRGRNLGRDDQNALLELGWYAGAGRSSITGWSLDVSWSETPHLLSNSARTPYDYLGGGRYEVARSIIDAAQISNINNAASWTAPDAGPGLPGEDPRIARVLGEFVRPIDLGTQRETGTLGYTLLFSERTQARLEFKNDTKNGSIGTGAGLGDRPPRSVNIQLPERIDYNTSDFKASLEHVGRNYHVDASWLYSQFENDIDTLTWNSLFHAPGFFTEGATDYDGIRIPGTTLYGTNGAIALSPDNTAQQFAVNGGINLPFRSSLTASVAYGAMKQDENLLPYATSTFGGTQTPDALPRSSADAEIETAMFNIVYAINPLNRVSTRFHYRYYDLDNKTDQEAWFGNTQDTSGRSILSQRFNIAYDLEQQNLGADVSYYFGKAGTLGFAYERERKERPQREVRATDEDIYRLSYRVRPLNRTTLSAKYSKAIRDGSSYDGEITDQTYAYDPLANLGDPNNPLFGFGDHPGLRRFDVADRDRDELDLSLGFMATESLDARFSYGYRRNDYDSDIASAINVWDPIRQMFVDAFVDPTQLGLLGDKARRLAFEINYMPNESLSLSGFVSREELELDQRGRFLDENNRLFGANTSIEAGNMDWQDTSGQFLWDADIEDRTSTLGLGLNYAPVDAKYSFSATFSHSRGVLDIDYVAGAGIAEDDTTNVRDYAEWTVPADARFKTNTLTFQYRYSLTQRWSLGLRYLFEIYRVTDWQQEGTAAHQTPFNENFVGDVDPETAGTSQDRAGSRLVRLGDLLAPDYDAHVGLITFEYRW